MKSNIRLSSFWFGNVEIQNQEFCEPLNLPKACHLSVCWSRATKNKVAIKLLAFSNVWHLQQISRSLFYLKKRTLGLFSVGVCVYRLIVRARGWIWSNHNVGFKPTPSTRSFTRLSALPVHLQATVVVVVCTLPIHLELFLSIVFPRFWTDVHLCNAPLPLT